MQITELASALLLVSLFVLKRIVSMCKEDIKIKRQTATRSVTVSVASGAIAPAFAANPDRVAITIGYIGAPAAAGGNYQAAVGGNVVGGPILAAISWGHPCDRAKIEDIGSAITLPISLYGIDGNAPNVVLTEIFFTHALGDL